MTGSEGYESRAQMASVGDGGYILESQSATEFVLPGMCLTVKVKHWRRTRHRMKADSIFITGVALSCTYRTV